MRRFVAALSVALVLGLVRAPAAAGQAPPPFTAPVPGPVVDPWRAPATPYGPGNRGIDLAADAGEPVRASADGEVTFAGAVGGARHVVVLHPGGVRTSYSFLADTVVRRGDRVRRGDVVGHAAGPVHFGVRVGETYVDPTALLAGVVEVHLVPDDLRRPRSVAAELVGLVRGLGPVVDASAAGIAWAGRSAAGAVLDAPGLAAEIGRGWVEDETARLRTVLEVLDYYDDVLTPQRLLQWAARLREIQADQARCTPAGHPVAVPSERRIAVLVGGFRAGRRASSVRELDTRALGYADRDVALFSYGGGQLRGRRRIAGIPVVGERQSEVNGDLTRSAARLRAVLGSVRARNPGVPVDVIAFSQGGLVARAALTGLDRLDRRDPGVEHLVTIGTPHRGANLATAAAGMSTSTAGWAVGRGLEGTLGIDTDAVSLAQMRAGSSFLDDLGREPLPPEVRVTSIASAGDLIVPALNSTLDGAVNVLLSGRPGPRVHTRLPGSRAVRREVALAIAGAGPTCRRTAFAGIQSLGVAAVEDTFGAGLAMGGHVVDLWTKGVVPAPGGGAGSR